MLASRTTIWVVAALLLLGTNCATSAIEGDPRQAERKIANQAGPDGGIPFDGWSEEALRPQNRTARIAVTPDGSRVALLWQHNAPGTNAFNGEPAAFATVARRPGSFGPVATVGKPPLGPLLPIALPRREYNVRHNEPLLIGQADGGFLALTMPMSANGYAALRPPTDFAYVEAAFSGDSWATPGLAKLRDTKLGSSLSEMSGDADGSGTVHVFGQGHLGKFQGGMGYQRRNAGDTLWDTVNLAAAYRPNATLHYFAEGWGYVSPKRNSLGSFDLHVAFAWNVEGHEDQMYGLYYLLSHDAGLTWKNASEQPVTLPLEASRTDSQAAVFPAGLGTNRYGGNQKGARSISVTAGPGGEPLIIRAAYVSGQAVQNRLYTTAGGTWIDVPVGGPLYWNFNRTHVSYNNRSGKVNVILLDPGSTASPGRVLLFSQPLADVRAGKSAWTEEILAQATNTRNYSSSLQVAVVPDSHFVIMFEPSYANPGRVSPVLTEAAMR